MKFITDIKKIKEYDVIVAGSGPAGIAAAISTQKNIKLRDIDVKDIQKKLEGN